VFDSTNVAALKAEGIDTATLSATNWRYEMNAKGEARTQTIARSLMGNGYHGLLIRSFAPGTKEDDLNLVLWRWGGAPPARLILIHDEGRLGDQRPDALAV
jgi:RES domain-containing protein